jgi:hypothetical protein
MNNDFLPLVENSSVKESSLDTEAPEGNRVVKSLKTTHGKGTPLDATL